jgi:hypothetical protein
MFTTRLSFPLHSACSAVTSSPTNHATNLRLLSSPVSIGHPEDLRLCSVRHPCRESNFGQPVPGRLSTQTTVAFEDAREFSRLQERGPLLLTARNRITVYRITQVERAPTRVSNPTSGDSKSSSRNVRKEVPLGEDRRSLPDYPPRNAAHTFQLKLAYADTAWGSGLFTSPSSAKKRHLDFANNEEITYVFQGLSKDGHFYVSADFRITHPKLPSGIDAKPKEREEHQRADSIFLTKQADDSFIPSLSKLRVWIGTLKLE